MEKETGTKNITATILKWIGIATAIVSLILGVNQLNNLWNAHKAKEARDLKITALIKDAQAQAKADDFETGWKTLEKAHELNPESRLIQDEQTNFAMLWLRKLLFKANIEKYSAVTQRLLPVLYHAANDTSGKAAADILAHIGWANYLKWREDGSDLKITELFEDAISKDSLNAYAHSMWGFWLMKRNDKYQQIPVAELHFEKALQDGRDTSFIRLMQLWAFLQSSYVDMQLPLFKAINQMRINNEKIPEGLSETIVDRAYNYYSKDVFEKLTQKLSPEDHLLTFQYLTAGMDFKDKPYRKLIYANLLDKANRQSQAIILLNELEADSTLIAYNWHPEISAAKAVVEKHLNQKH